MKKKLLVLLAGLVTVLMLAACGAAPASSSALLVSEPPAASGAPRTAMRIAGLKGPTTMGMVKLMEDAEQGTALHDYQVDIYGTADEVNGLLINGDVDIAMLPANVASVLYSRTDGAIQVAAINTLGVLYIVETGETIQSVEDLRGRTIYATGKGQTPEYVLNHILRENGIDPEKDVTIEYKSEATEVAALLNAGQDAIALLPQPYVTAVQMQNDTVRMALDLTKEWEAVSPGSALVTGVAVVRKAFLEENAAAFAEFLQEYEASIQYVNDNTAEAAELVAKFGIVEKAPIAAKALPYCSIVFIAGAEMQQKLLGYLEVLHAQRPEAVGGALPDDAFFYGI